MESKSVGRTVMEGLGVLSVVLSLCFVAFQIKQSNDHARVVISFELTDAYNGYSDLLAGDAELAGIMTRLQEPEPNFTDVERLRAQQAVSRLFNVWLSYRRAYVNGLATEDQYESLKGQIAATATRWPGAVPFWRQLIETTPHWADWPMLAPIVEQM